jgi:hypothetical protein
MGGKKPNDVPPPNKPALILVGFVAIFALVAICAVLFKPVKNVSLQEDGTRTVMIYLIGSDLESSQGSATFDINEMLESDFDDITKDEISTIKAEDIVISEPQTQQKRKIGFVC